MDIEMEDILLIAGLTAQYIHLNENIGSYHPKVSEHAESIIESIQFEILHHFGAEYGDKIIDEIRDQGNVQRTYGDYKKHVNL